MRAVCQTHRTRIKDWIAPEVQFGEFAQVRTIRHCPHPIWSDAVFAQVEQEQPREVRGLGQVRQELRRPVEPEASDGSHAEQGVGMGQEGYPFQCVISHFSAACFFTRLASSSWAVETCGCFLL